MQKDTILNCELKDLLKIDIYVSAINKTKIWYTSLGMLKHQNFVTGTMLKDKIHNCEIKDLLKMHNFYLSPINKTCLNINSSKKNLFCHSHCAKGHNTQFWFN